MGFAERNGFAKEKLIQINTMDDALRNRLYNVVHKYFCDSPYSESDYLKYVVDKLGHKVETSDRFNWQIVDRTIGNSSNENPWYMPYEVLEYFLESIEAGCEECDYKSIQNCKSCEESEWKSSIVKEINSILEQEKSGYRLIGNCFIDIVNEIELQALSDAINSPYESVRKHINKAISFYADRENPDYENSIKESISAVESMCCILTGSQATLGKTLDKLENDAGIEIHSSLKSAFKKLYGYTSDSNGIRHGGIDFTSAPSEDAKYMLISCAAFVNYLIEKQSKLQK